MPQSATAATLGRSCRLTLEQWQPPTREQDQLRLLYLDHLEHEASGWARSCRGSHLTASAIICGPLPHQVLLTLHAKIGRWLQTGGHLEPDDDSLPGAALRESAEESGLPDLRIDPVPLLLSRHEVTCAGRPTFHLDVQFLVRAAVASAPVFGSESLDVRWFSTSKLPDVDASVLALVAAAAGRLRLE